MIASLPDHIAALPRELRLACERIFDVATATGYTDPPPTMHGWIERHFGSVADVREQTIVRVVNRLTLEAALFNPVRARRPIESRGGDAELETRIAAALANDIFAEPLRDTPADVFGRIRGEFCVTASNVAKYDGWHGVIVFDEPHPLRFDAPRLRDYLGTAMRWMAAAHARDEQAIFPLIFWNCLPKSGATIMHGHMQLALGRGLPYMRAEVWRRAAHAYRAAHGASYFEDLFGIHQALGLDIPCADDLRAFAHLTPLRNREIVLLADQGESVVRGPLSVTQSGALPTTDHGLRTTDDLADALHSILRGLIDAQGIRAFNVVIALPPIGPTSEDWAKFPVLVRLGDRGDPLAISADLGATELYATGCITADPFAVAANLRAALDPIP